MSKVKASSFSVRFCRRGVAKSADQTPRAAVQDNVFASNQPLSRYGDDMSESFEPAVRLEIHALQEHTAPRDVRKTAEAPLEHSLWAAAKSGDCGAIRIAVMRGADLDARDGQGRTAINIATQYNHKDAIKTLLAAKEMRRMAALGELPKTAFFQKFSKIQKV